jgi:ATP-dependent Clp protease ATP-binding subunit ClpA
MGARPLLRVIDDKIKKPLSREMLFGRLINGGIVQVDFVKDELIFEYLDPLPITKDEQLIDENVSED